MQKNKSQITSKSITQSGLPEIMRSMPTRGMIS